MIAGRGIIWWILMAFVAVVVFLLGLELIPLLFSIVDVTLTARLVKLLSLLIAIGVVWYGRGVA